MFGYGKAKRLQRKLKRSESQQKQQNRGYHGIYLTIPPRL